MDEALWKCSHEASGGRFHHSTFEHILILACSRYKCGRDHDHMPIHGNRDSESNVDQQGPHQRKSLALVCSMIIKINRQGTPRATLLASKNFALILVSSCKPATGNAEERKLLTLRGSRPRTPAPLASPQMPPCANILTLRLCVCGEQWDGRFGVERHGLLASCFPSLGKNGFRMEGKGEYDVCPT
jgi:hypothetical protein